MHTRSRHDFVAASFYNKILYMSISYFYLATVSFFIGVAVATFYNFSLPLITWLLFIGLCLTLIDRRKNKRPPIGGLLFFSLAIMAFSIGALRLEIASWNFGHSPLEPQIGQKVTLVGQIVSPPEAREKNTMLEVETATDKILVSVDRYETATYGDVIEIKGKLSQPESFETDLGRTFDYPGYLKAKGIEYRISFATIKVLEPAKGNWFLSRLFNFKTAFMENVAEYIPDPAAALGGGLLLGVKQALGDELENAFRRTGIIHIVVLSGYNVMLVVIFVMFILSYFIPKRLQTIFGLVAIATFALLVGLSATVLRASIMASLLLLLRATGRTYDVMRGLLVAATIMVVINPYILVYDVGFQLSFLATSGLILLAPHVEKVFSKVTNFLNIRSFITATIATQIAVLPLLLYQIGEFSVVAVIVNVLVLPMVAAAMLLTFLTGMAAFVSVPLASFIAVPAYLSLQYINEIALWFSSLPYAAFNVPAFPFYVVPLAYLVLAFLLWRFYNPALGSGYGDLGENLLHTAKDQDLKDWEIVEEKEILPEFKLESKQKSGPKKDPDSDEVPIFFR